MVLDTADRKYFHYPRKFYWSALAKIVGSLSGSLFSLRVNMRNILPCNPYKTVFKGSGFPSVSEPSAKSHTAIFLELKTDRKSVLGHQLFCASYNGQRTIELFPTFGSRNVMLQLLVLFQRLKKLTGFSNTATFFFPLSNPKSPSPKQKRTSVTCLLFIP